MVGRARPICRPGRLCDLRRKVARRSQPVRPRREPALPGELSRTDLRRFRFDPAARRGQPAVCRGSRSARPAKSPAQSGGRVEPVHARRGGTGRRLAGSTIQGGRGEYARHTDREVSPFTGWPHAASRGEAAPNGDRIGAGLPGWPGYDRSQPRDRHHLSRFRPFASRPGYGDIVGVPEALWLWYGTDLAEANRVLIAPATKK